MSHAALRGRIGPAPTGRATATPRTARSSTLSSPAARGPLPAAAWFGDFADAAAAATSVPTAVAGLGALAAVGVGILVTDPERR
jgi:hypothetical protein